MKLNLFAGLAVAALFATPVIAKDKGHKAKGPKTEADCTTAGGMWEGKGKKAHCKMADHMAAPAAGNAAAPAPAAGEPAPAADGAK